VRGVARVPAHRGWEHSPRAPGLGPEGGPEDTEEKFVNRPCYEFNRALAREMDDRHCRHCRHYLTARCPHIAEFLDDVEDFDSE
jgi:hypothetical protein